VLDALDALERRGRDFVNGDVDVCVDVRIGERVGMFDGAVERIGE